MIGTIRKHSTWMWMVIIVVVIISFVFWGSQSSRTDGRRVRNDLGTLAGETVTQESFSKAQREVYLRYFLNTGEWPDTDGKRMGFEPERETYYRLLLIQKQEQLGIHVSSESVARIANSILRSLNRGNPLPLDVFAKQVLLQRGMAVEDFERFVRHELGMQQLVAVTGLGGKLVTPQEAQVLYEREHQELATQAVFFPASNYLAGVTATPEAVSQFYTNQMARYRLPDRVQVSYVKFAISNFLVEATKQFNELTNLNEIIDAKYQQLGTNFFAEAKTPEEKKGKIREVLFKNQMLFNARKKANEFATVVFAVEPMRTENLESLAKDKGLTVQVSQPFDKEDGPKDLEVAADFVKAAFGLTSSEPFAGPLTGNDGVYVIALKQQLPSENPPFEIVRDQVTHDYQFAQAVLLARMAGDEFHSTLTNGLTSGKSFTAICTEAKLHPVLPPPLSLSTRSLTNVESHVSLYQFKQAVFSTPPGKASVFTPTADGGFMVFVQSKLPLDETKLKADLPGFMNSVRQTRQNEAFNEWFRREADRGLRDIPYFQQQQTPRLSGAPKK
jgi:hypothetical protein